MSGLKDSRIPLTAWQYRKMTELNPKREKSKKGSREEYLKLVSSMESYYRDSRVYFDVDRLKSDFELFLEIYGY